MIEFAVEIGIARPVADVFAYVTDPTKLGTWQTNTVCAIPESTEPLGPGSRLREVHRAPGGKELESIVEVSKLEPDRSFGLRTVEGPFPIHADISFEPSPGGTRMRFVAHGEPAGAMRLAQPILRRTLKRQFKGYCETLKRVLENGAMH